MLRREGGFGLDGQGKYRMLKWTWRKLVGEELVKVGVRMEYYVLLSTVVRRGLMCVRLLSTVVLGELMCVRLLSTVVQGGLVCVRLLSTVVQGN